mgnify:CR=1 FL=1
MRQLLLVNPNTTQTMTESMVAAARKVLPSDTDIISFTSDYGPPSIEGYYDEAFAIPPMLEHIALASASVEGVIIGCFDDTGVEAARCISDVPVIGLCQAACQHASILAGSFSIITTLSCSIHPLQRRVIEYGFERQCRSIRASEIPVLALENGNENTLRPLFRQIEKALERDGSEAIVLGCAGMVSLRQALQDRYQVPVIEGVTAAVSVMQGLIRLPTFTSRRNTFKKPRSKQYAGLFERFSPGSE